MSRAHVVGAGLAGLAAAVALAGRGVAVTLSEAGTQAGGRCRSYHDPQLGLTIDNGNHLLLSGNRAARRYLATIGAGDRLTGPGEARLDFHDLASGTSWAIRPNAGPLPWWLLDRRRRVPGTRARDYLALARLARARRDATIAQTIPTEGTLWRRLVEPFLVSALNTPAREGSAALAGAVIRETLARGGRACRPLIASPTLAAAFVDPALAWLRARGADIRFGRRLRALGLDGARVATLDFGGGPEPAGDAAVVLAVPAWAATGLVPGLDTPDAHHAIVNAHYRVAPPAGARPIVGVIGGTAEWVFAFPDRLSVTVSAADRLLGVAREALAATRWRDVAAVHGLDPDRLPPWQVVREKRATFAATPAQDARRPAAATRWRNLVLAGDWTRTGLPATIEAAIRSGETAARLASAMGDVRAA